MNTTTSTTTLTRRLVLFAIILILPLALAACGGDEQPADEMSQDEAGVVADARVEDGVQVVEITAGSMGYEPERVRLQPGVPARLVVRRVTSSQCLERMQIPAFGIEKTDLPMNEPVTFEFTPEKIGTFEFVCGMDMQRGTIVVES